MSSVYFRPLWGSLGHCVISQPDKRDGSSFHGDYNFHGAEAAQVCALSISADFLLGQVCKRTTYNKAPFFALEEGISIRCLPSHTLGSAPVADNPRNICLKYAEEAWQPLPYAFGNGYKNMAFQVDLVFHFDLFSDSHYVESLK